uniref:Ig-like domain-containing protein n=1 Tax=Xenopus tropicalis TaxID=8364 RepID=A0A803J3H7_XENTR
GEIQNLFLLRSLDVLVSSSPDLLDESTEGPGCVYPMYNHWIQQRRTGPTAPLCPLDPGIRPSLYAPDVIIEEETERGVTCRVSNYYPKMIKIHWIKYVGVSTNEPLENGDGTFTVTSQLLLNPSMGDDGGKYSCVISHRSLGDSLVLDFTLSVKGGMGLNLMLGVGVLGSLEHKATI